MTVAHTLAQVLLCSLLPTSLLAADLASLVESATPAVVSLRVEDRSGNPISEGTGFFVDPDGGLITNHHVIEGAGKIVAESKDGINYLCTGVLSLDEKRDLAFLQFAAKKMPFLKVGDGSTLKPGAKIAVIGNPAGLTHSVSDGILSAQRDIGSVSLLQITAPISPGSSGSPVLDFDGVARGVATLSFREGQALNFAVDCAHVEQLLKARDTFVSVPLREALPPTSLKEPPPPAAKPRVPKPAATREPVRVKGTPREIGETVPESLQAFFAAHYGTVTQNDARRWAGMFTDNPYYCYSKGITTRPHLQKQRQKLIDKYPVRKYELLAGSTFEEREGGGRALLRFSYIFDYRGSSKVAGECTETLQLVWVGDRWLISDYRETVTKY